MKFEDYRAHDAVGLAELVATKEVSAGELLDTALARAAEVNPKINAIVADLAQFARGEAAKAKGPFAGVPFLLKDLSTLLGGFVTSSGSRLFAGAVAEADSALVKAYREAGLVIFGKTNTPEFGLLPITEPALFGPCRNPWDLSRTPGGSSGGSAAAVAAGIVPAAQASDGGGSIRIPAAASGLFGMKPSRGRVSAAPAGEGWAGASVLHAVTRSVRDSAALLDISCKPQVGDPYFLQPPERPFAEEVAREPGRLKVAFLAGTLVGEPIGADAAAGVRETAKLLEDLGHAVVEIDRAPGDVAAMRAAALTVMSSSVTATVDLEVARRGRPLDRSEIEGITWANYRRGQGQTAAAYLAAITTIHAYGRALAGLFETHDVLLCATLGVPALPIGALTEPGADINARLYAFMPNTQAFNNSGMPAMTLPLAWSAEGLPLGMQFAAKIGAEAMLFRLAGQIERARPWFDRVAPL